MAIWGKLARLTAGIMIMLALPAFASTENPQEGSGAPNDDTLTVSFLTCEPGPAIYELYGHSAIRIRTASGIDMAFNYGMFDFSSPNFVWRFILGKTDYRIAAYPFADFIYEYSHRGSAVIEQVLNLKPEEKNKLFRSLVNTAMKEGWTYRYNFLYDNCTTRARDEIENCVSGTISYAVDSSKAANTYRKIIHHYTDNSPWSEFGEDLLLGQAADEPINYRQEMFSPIYMKDYNATASIVDNAGNKRPLVTSTRVFPPVEEMKEVWGFPIPPAGVFGTFLAVTILICVAEIRRNKVFAAFELPLMLVQGLAGCLIALLFFFSEHPTVSTNWLLMVLNPLPLVFLVPRAIALRRKNRKPDLYPAIAAAVEGAFLIISLFISQSFSVSIYCFTLSLCAQSATGAYIERKHAAANAAAK